MRVSLSCRWDLQECEKISTIGIEKRGMGMKTLHIKKYGAIWQCYDGEVIIYSGELIKEGSTDTMILNNAFGDEILKISYTKSGFKLFRSSKINKFTITMHGQEGVLLPKEHSYEWSFQNIKYSFVCGEIENSLGVIMRDHEATLACVKEEDITLFHSAYSAEFCAFTILMREIKERVVLDEDKFRRSYVQAMSL